MHGQFGLQRDGHEGLLRTRSIPADDSGGSLEFGR